MMFLPPPSHAHMTALDACSVEAATLRKDQVLQVELDGRRRTPFEDDMAEPRQVGIKGHVGRQVYVYMWAKSVGPQDRWAHFVSQFKEVRLGLFDMRQVRMCLFVCNLAFGFE